MNMPGRGDNPPGHDDENPGRGDTGNEEPDNPDRDAGEFYVIDETVELEEFGNKMGYIWDIETDPDTSESYSIRAIARNGSFNVRSYIVPREETESFRNGEKIWWEHRSSSGGKISTNPTIGQTDEDPFEHGGDYSLIIEGSNTRHTDNPKVSVKFRSNE